MSRRLRVVEDAYARQHGIPEKHTYSFRVRRLIHSLTKKGIHQEVAAQYVTLLLERFRGILPLVEREMDGTLDKADHPTGGALSRKEFELLAEKALDRQQKRLFYTSPYHLAIIDGDRFGSLNEIFGKAFVDRIIEVVSTLLKEYMERHKILACRYGGEEFVLLIPGDRKRAEQIIRNFLQEVDKRMRHPHNAMYDPFSLRKVSFTVGVTKVPTKPRSGKERYASAFSHAEKALREGKRIGRGKIYYFPSNSSNPSSPEENTSPSPPSIFSILSPPSVFLPPFGEHSDPLCPFLPSSFYGWQKVAENIRQDFQIPLPFSESTDASSKATNFVVCIKSFFETNDPSQPIFTSKHANDLFRENHLAGDEYIRAIATALFLASRKHHHVSLVWRENGDTFFVLLKASSCTETSPNKLLTDFLNDASAILTEYFKSGGYVPYLVATYAELPLQLPLAPLRDALLTSASLHSSELKRSIEEKIQEKGSHVPSADATSQKGDVGNVVIFKVSTHEEETARLEFEKKVKRVREIIRSALLLPSLEKRASTNIYVLFDSLGISQYFAEDVSEREAERIANSIHVTPAVINCVRHFMPKL